MQGGMRIWSRLKIYTWRLVWVPCHNQQIDARYFAQDLATFNEDIPGKYGDIKVSILYSKKSEPLFCLFRAKKSQILQTIFGSQYLFKGSKFSSLRLLATSWRAAAFQTCGLFATMSRSTPALSLPLVLDAPQSRLSFQTHAQSLREVKLVKNWWLFFHVEHMMFTIYTSVHHFPSTLSHQPTLYRSTTTRSLNQHKNSEILDAWYSGCQQSIWRQSAKLGDIDWKLLETDSSNTGA